jgi:hypothetical protein
MHHMVHNTSFWVHTRFNLLYSLATSLHKLATTLDRTYQVRWYVSLQMVCFSLVVVIYYHLQILVGKRHVFYIITIYGCTDVPIIQFRLQ